ncbi:hypothetical protein E1263_35905 [Kribbella antibiotica]|uniref:Uncharacterized protein n=1 Tax=Kribbella antibiotica TaxID=190195 RepID=A0A4R4YQ77_9ACTN|nr:hypothetical protein [Kribbella antibiotica]TDD46750.1 hypothetical protein E1263_35905 [Kribbella antibiotica]
MNPSVPAAFETRLQRLAVDIVVSRTPMDDAVVLAEDLLAAGFEGDATVEVAVLRRDVTYGDAGPLVRAMLAEYGIELPIPGDEEAEYRLLLRTFGLWKLPIGDFYAPFLHQLPPWDKQDSLERALMELFVRLDNASVPAQADEVVERMRATVRAALQAD